MKRFLILLILIFPVTTIGFTQNNSFFDTIIISDKSINNLHFSNKYIFSFKSAKKYFGNPNSKRIKRLPYYGGGILKSYKFFYKKYGASVSFFGSNISNRKNELRLRYIDIDLLKNNSKFLLELNTVIKEKTITVSDILTLYDKDNIKYNELIAFEPNNLTTQRLEFDIDYLLLGYKLLIYYNIDTNSVSSIEQILNSEINSIKIIFGFEKELYL